MKSGGTFILGGLLQGLGKGITNMHEERRQNALLKLKREWEVSDQATSAAASEAAANRAQEDRLEALAYAGAQESEQAAQRAQAASDEAERARLARAAERREDRTWQTEDKKTEFVQKKELARYDEYLMRTRPKEEKQKNIHAAVNNEDGSTTLLFNDGTTEVRSDLPKARETKRGEEGGTVLDRRNRGQPAAPAAAPPTAVVDERARAMAQLGQVYAKATPQRYPGLFRDGKKIPMNEAKQMILQRYSR